MNEIQSDDGKLCQPETFYGALMMKIIIARVYPVYLTTAKQL